MEWQTPRVYFYQKVILFARTTALFFATPKDQQSKERNQTNYNVSNYYAFKIKEKFNIKWFCSVIESTIHILDTIKGFKNHQKSN